MTCSGDNGDCPKPVEAAGLCAGHRKRKTMGLSTNEPLRTYGQWETLMAAVRAYWDAENDADFERDKHRTRNRIERRIAVAAIRYAKAVARKNRNRPTAAAQCPKPD